MFMTMLYFTHLAPHTLFISSNIVARHAYKTFLGHNVRKSPNGFFAVRSSASVSIVSCVGPRTPFSCPQDSRTAIRGQCECGAGVELGVPSI
jgi:hypothetical protein